MAKSKDKVADQKVTDQKIAESSIVYDLESLWTMKFRDSKTGQISMVRKAFKPRGKLEFYHPDED